MGIVALCVADASREGMRSSRALGLNLVNRPPPYNPLGMGGKKQWARARLRLGEADVARSQQKRGASVRMQVGATTDYYFWRILNATHADSGDRT